MLVARRGDDRHALTDYRGLGSARPVLAGLLTLFLLAQAGVPFTGGFVAKLSVFSAAIDVGQYWLAVVGMLTAVIGAFVYLRIVLAMYAPPDDAAVAEGPRIVIDAGTGLALTLAAGAIVFLGVVPGIMLDFAHAATQLLAH
jgi:NADH-quinone oxidoreductase subunit N